MPNNAVSAQINWHIVAILSPDMTLIDTISDPLVILEIQYWQSPQIYGSNKENKPNDTEYAPALRSQQQL